jgi:transposase-like protein
MRKKIKEKKQAINLRKEGKSINEIARELSVSKSSVSTWVRDIRLTNKQKKELSNNNKAFGNSFCADFFRKKREEYQKNGVRLLEKHGYEFLCGCMLYWAEGTKERSKVNLINSDVYLLKFFLSFLYKFFDITKDDIKIHCTYYEGADIKKIENYWIEHLGLPKSALNKSTKVSSLRKNNEFAMCRILVYKVNIVQAIYGAIQHHCNFINKKWLQ